MLSDLPKALQQQVLYYLETNNFTTAKKIHDDWLNGLQPEAIINTQGSHDHQDHKNLIYVSLLACTLKSLSHMLHPLMPIFFKASNFTEIGQAGQ